MKKVLILITSTLVLLVGMSGCRKVNGDAQVSTDKVELTSEAQTTRVTTGGIDLIKCYEGGKLIGTGNYQEHQITGDWFILSTEDELWRTINIEVRQNITGKVRTILVHVRQADSGTNFTVTQQCAL